MPTTNYSHPLLKRIATITFVATLMAGSALTTNPRSVQAAGSTITVNSLSDDQTAGIGVCLQSGIICLRNAITTANAASTDTTINFSLTGSQTITLASTLTISNTSSNPITIDGGGTVILDGSNTIQVLNVSSGSVVTLENLTIQHGSSTSEGGGIENGGSLTIDNSTLSNNSATNYGGGISNIGTLTISNSTLSDNSANGTIYGGGAIYNDYATVSITSSILSGNSASSSGGGIFTYSGGVTISSSTLLGNSAAYGGGIGNYSDMLTISNSTLYNNSASSSGGGIYNLHHPVTITNSTIAGNSATTGGGIYSNTGTINLLSTIVANNAATNGTNINGAINSLGHNLIGDSTGANGFVASDQLNVANPGIAALANNGGSTPTMALQSGSPAIDAGDCSGYNNGTLIIPPVTTDQRGVSRGTPCDVGAYEGSLDTTATATYTSTATLTPTFTPSSTATVTLSDTSTSTNTATATSTITQIPAHIDTMGIDRNNIFSLRLHNSSGVGDLTTAFNIPGRNLPIVGDWTGAGFDSIGVLDQNTGNFTLCTSNLTSACSDSTNRIPLSFTFGNPNDTPLSGRWMPTATHDGIGVYRPTNGILYAKNDLTTGYSDYSLVLGNPGDQGIAGDWTGIGQDGLGVFRPSNLNFYLVNHVGDGIIYSDENFQYGGSTDLAIAGDWIGQGHDGVGVFRPANATVYLKNTLSTGNADNAFLYGASTDLPIAGHWQTTYPPIGIAKTTTPVPGSISVPGGNQIGG